VDISGFEKKEKELNTEIENLPKENKRSLLFFPLCISGLTLFFIFGKNGVGLILVGSALVMDSARQLYKLYRRKK
jgi:hypothetical protein